MSSALPSVAFHIGAHKTATSHLQRCLLNASDALAEHGVLYFGPEFFRQPGQSIHATFGLRDGPSARAPLRLRDLARNGHHLVLSEENYIGPLNDPAGFGLMHRYPDAGPKVAALAGAIGQRIDIHMAVRRPTDYLNSGYCQMLLGGKVRPFSDYRDANPTTSVDWPAVVSSLRRAEGVGRVTVWRHEDYMHIFRQLAAGLVGQDAAHCVPLIPRKRNPGLSEAAVARLHQEAPLADHKRGYEVRGALPIAQGRPRFDGFTKQDHANSAAVYDRQLAHIAQIQGVRVLQPEID